MSGVALVDTPGSVQGLEVVPFVLLGVWGRRLGYHPGGLLGCSALASLSTRRPQKGPGTISFKVSGNEPFVPSMATEMRGIMGGATSALGGIRKAGELAESAAIDVQRAFHPETHSVTAEPAAVVEVSPAARDLASSFTDMMKAEGMNAANVKVLQTADDMTKELTRIKR